MIVEKLKELGIELPAYAKPVATYVPYKRFGDCVIISGQLPMESGTVKYKGAVGSHRTLEEAQAAARLCAVNILAVLKEAIGGDWTQIKQCVRLGGFVNAGPEFTDHPKVINGASDLMVAVLGDKGYHARAAVGCSALPLGATVEVEAIFELHSRG